ncbi:MAG: 50S ribosomal protein L22 [Patescibacteria group bacterium]
MEITAFSKSIRISPRKLRPITEAVKGMPATLALDRLQFLNKFGRPVIVKLIKSAIANGVNNLKLEAQNLKIKNIIVNEGTRMKRQAKGRKTTAGRGIIHKRMSHIKVILTTD